jgi:thiamine biosynthesis lipoprotein
MNSERVIKATLKIADKAIATSGNYRKFYEKDGVRYSHTINPKTGYPVEHSLLSATVVADSASIADAYATAFMVMGLAKTKAFLKTHPRLEVYLIYSDSSSKFQSWSTAGMNELIEEL